MWMAVKAMFGLALVATVSACALGERDAVAPGPTDASSARDMIFSSYTAVDRLIQNSQSKLEPSKPVLVTSLVDINDFNASSSFGRLVGEQMVSRLANAGYSVVEVTLRNNLLLKRGGGQFMLSRDVREISESRSAQAVIVGTYAVAKEDLFVNLRLIRASDGTVLSAYDYAIALDPNISSLAPPPAAYLSTGKY